MSRVNTTNPDEQHLGVLAICFYALAAMSALSGCVLMMFALVGVAVLNGAIDAGPPEAAAFLGWVLIAVESALALFVWTMSSLELLTGRSLASHSRYRLCFVMACFELLNFPIGTALGIFTILVLSRPSVRDLFAGIPHRDPRLDMLAEFDEYDDAGPVTPKGMDDGTIREGTPS